MNSNFIYIITVLHNGNDFTYNQCMLDFDEVLKDCFDEGYLLSNKMYIFFSNDEYSEIERRLEQLKENNNMNYSYCLVDITEQVLSNKFKLDTERLYVNQVEISNKLKEDIKTFKRNKTKISTKKEVSSTQDMIDQILDKISRDGKESLTEEELEILKSL